MAVHITSQSTSRFHQSTSTLGAGILAEELPYELQCYIFSLASTTPYGYTRISKSRALALVKLTSVCSGWRRIALSHHALWSIIHLCRPEFAELSYIRSISESSVPLHLFIDAQELYGFKQERFWDDTPRTVSTQLLFRVILKSQSSRVQTLKVVLPIPVLQDTLSCVSQYTTSLLMLQSLVLGTPHSHPLGHRDEEWPAQLSPNDLEQINRRFVPIEELPAPELRSLTLTYLPYQRFAVSFIHLDTLIFGPTVYFSAQSFSRFCSWLLELPSLRNLEIKRPFHYTSNADDLIHFDSFTDAADRRLQLQTLVIDERPTFPRLFRLLGLVDPANTIRNHVILEIRNHLSGPSALTTQSHILRLVDPCLLSHPLPLNVLSFVTQSHSWISGKQFGKICATRWAGSPEVKLGCALELPWDMMEDTYQSPSSAKLFIQLDGLEEETEDGPPLTFRFLTTAFLRCVSIGPALTHAYVDCGFNLTLEDWQIFLSKHSGLEVLLVQQKNVHPLFLALLDLRQEDVLQTIMLLGPVFPLVQVLLDPTENAWSAVNAYVRAKERTEVPLRRFLLDLSVGLSRHDLQPLTEFVLDSIEFIAAMTTLSDDESDSDYVSDASDDEFSDSDSDWNSEEVENDAHDYERA